MVVSPASRRWRTSVPLPVSAPPMSTMASPTWRPVAGSSTAVTRHAPARAWAVKPNGRKLSTLRKRSTAPTNATATANAAARSSRGPAVARRRGMDCTAPPRAIAGSVPREGVTGSGAAMIAGSSRGVGLVPASGVTKPPRSFKILAAVQEIGSRRTDPERFAALAVRRANGRSAAERNRRERLPRACRKAAEAAGSRRLEGSGRLEPDREAAGHAPPDVVVARVGVL